MLTTPDRAHDGHRMRVIRSRHQHGVYLVAHRVVHFPEIIETLGFRKFVERMGGTAGVHVAQRDDVLPGHRTEVGATPATNSDGSDANLVVGGVLAVSRAQYVARHHLKTKGSRS